MEGVKLMIRPMRELNSKHRTEVYQEKEFILYLETELYMILNE